ncbi:hypothetical protein FUAX_20390 [Fulvitalea axinellae]|uniref:Uncharacterized protein n=1 Tax=Fulvitalea axinellae TaxID=1182444 RepID=A0AAU9CW16_9BACT|nr:hypothetical protein FUAX_20390 [Fulvitalea axinellae]
MFSPKVHRQKKHRNADPAPNVIQAKIGFEFELSAWRTYRSVPGREPPQEKYPKATSLVSNPDFEISTDYVGGGSDLEVDTRPFDESTEGLEEALVMSRKVRSLFNRLQSPGDRYSKKTSPVSELTDFGKVREPDGFIEATGESNVYPQITAGIALDAIPGMFRDLGADDQGTESREEKERKMPGRVALCNYKPVGASLSEPLQGIKLFHMHRFLDRLPDGITYFKECFPEFSDWEPSPEMCGLLALTTQYMEDCGIRNNLSPKIGFMFIARTDFARITELLPPREQELFLGSNADNWLKLFRCFNYKEEEDMERPLYRGGVYHYNPYKNHQVMDALKLGDWILNMAKGKDLLTKKHFPDRQYAEEPRSLGEFGDRTEPVGQDGRQAPILEFRKAKTLASADELPEMVEKSFKAIYAINHGIDRKYGEEFSLA